MSDNQSDNNNTEINLLLYIQKHRKLLKPFVFIFLSDIRFLFYFGISCLLGISYFYTLVFSFSVGFVVRAIIHSKSPSHPDLVETQFKPIYGMPSLDGVISVVSFGYLALFVDTLYISILCLILIFIAGFTKLYSGTHTPTQVVVGWLLGGVLLLFCNWSNRIITLLISKFSKDFTIPAYIHLIILISMGVAAYFLFFRAPDNKNQTVESKKEK